VTYRVCERFQTSFTSGNKTAYLSHLWSISWRTLHYAVSFCCVIVVHLKPVEDTDKKMGKMLWCRKAWQDRSFDRFCKKIRDFFTKNKNVCNGPFQEILKNIWFAEITANISVICDLTQRYVWQNYSEIHRSFSLYFDLNIEHPTGIPSGNNWNLEIKQGEPLNTTSLCLCLALLHFIVGKIDD
jgi:hypothetical protein